MKSDLTLKGDLIHNGGTCAIENGTTNALVLGEALYLDTPGVLIGSGDCYIKLLPDNTIVVGPAFNTETIRIVLQECYGTGGGSSSPDLVQLTGASRPTLVEGLPMVTHRVSNDKSSILCLLCGMWSWHPEDVSNLYCGKCHKFHERVR